MRILVLAATFTALCVSAGVASARTIPVGGPPVTRAAPPPVAPRVIAPPVAPRVTPQPVAPRVVAPPVAPRSAPQPVVPQAPPPSPVVVPATLPPPGQTAPATTGPQTYPTGCRDVDIVASQVSFLFHSKIYNFHQIKHWCWRNGAIYDERHAWSFDGGSTACFDEVYPANHWTFTWWRGLADSGDFSEERAHVTNCVFHIGDWKEFYPDVKIWAYADGTYKTEPEN